MTKSRRKRIYDLILQRCTKEIEGGVTFGSFEGQPIEYPEHVLHEMAHWTLLRADPATTDSEVMWRLPPYEEDWQMDLWELRALAVEYALGELLKIPLHGHQLSSLFLNGNTCNALRSSHSVAQSLIKRFASTPRCQRAAHRIVHLLQYGATYDQKRRPTP